MLSERSREVTFGSKAVVRTPELRPDVNTGAFRRPFRRKTVVINEEWITTHSHFTVDIPPCFQAQWAPNL